MGKKLIRLFFILILALVGVLVIIVMIVNQPVPNGTMGQDAEALADEMLATLNKEAFDSLEYIEFSFREKHEYRWDLANNTVWVKWEEDEVYLNLNKIAGAFDERETEAYEYFINDSFWLVAPFKIRDDGVIRSTVEVENGRGLLVTYSSGGLTPGDSYLWIIDEKGFPKSWRLWTSNIPVGGLELSWSGWVNTDQVWFSTLHESKIATIPVTVHSTR